MTRGDIIEKLKWFFKSTLIPGTSKPPVENPRHPRQRYAPYHILEKEGILKIIWFEDVLAIYSSDTAIFDLYIVVSDEPKAAAALRRSGYRDMPRGNAPTNKRTRHGWTRLEPPGGEGFH